MPGSKRSRRWAAVIAVCAAAGIAAYLLRGDGTGAAVSLDQFLAAAERGELSAVELEAGAERITAVDQSGERIEVEVPAELFDLVTERVLATDTQIDATGGGSRSVWWELLIALLPPLIVVGALVAVIVFVSPVRRTMPWRNRRQTAGKIPDVTFDHVAGTDDAVDELRELASLLRSTNRRLGVRGPTGVLLHGPPGTGKTLLARALAGEAGVPFYPISGAEFVELYVGIGASRVRSLFKDARSHAPAIVFVDELDAVGRRRSDSNLSGNEEREQTLNQLLVEMDGFDGRNDVIVLAATNRIDVLDPALLRPGRFDRHISVDPPDRAGRLEILELHSSHTPLAADVDLDAVAARTPGFTGADLASLINEGALLAGRSDRVDVTQTDLEQAIDRVLAGAGARTHVLTREEKERIAFHEAGHALTGHLLPGADPVLKVSIMGRGRALGWTMTLPEEERQLLTTSELRDRIVTLLGGRAAEITVFGECSTGAADDIERATEIARSMVTRFGMDESIGPVSAEGTVDDDLVAERIRELLRDAEREAAKLLAGNLETLQHLALALIAHETLDRITFRSIVGEAPGRVGAVALRDVRAARRAAAVAAITEADAIDVRAGQDADVDLPAAESSP